MDSSLQPNRELWWETPTADLIEVVQLKLEKPYIARFGGELAEVQVAFQSWGKLNAAADNAVLIPHPLTTDLNVSSGGKDSVPGWWEPLVGPGKALDTNELFVVCPNIVGGCYGSTGPRFPAPDGEPWLDRFPLLTPKDMMRLQRLFIRQIGIKKLRMVIGPSMGGMLAWECAIEGCEDVETVVIIAAPLKTSAYQIGLNWLQRRGIEMDLSDDDHVSKWGRMVARGVGMLSYRSPLGLEEKFGREWFKQPGSTLGDRGMFNIESWLRQHGRRLLKRFDPYTYILFSRAMDLHDVSEGRGNLVSALENVRCKTVVVGASSDYLYGPEEVHLGADILGHLGKEVQYRELRSPHGHDAVFIEMDQIDTILRDALEWTVRPARLPAARELKHVRLGILGAGKVAASFIRLLQQQKERLARDFGLEFHVAGVSELDAEKQLDPAFNDLKMDFDPPKFVEAGDYNVLIELTRGECAKPLVEAALKHGRPVVTPNKPLIRNHGPEMERLGLAHGVRIAWHNSLVEGWPLLFSVERPLAQERIESIHAVLSGTCNIVLEEYEQGGTLDSGLEKAGAAGFTEQDPELDLSGWDTAQKLAILISRASGQLVAVEDMHVEGIHELDPELVKLAPKIGLRVKLVALYDRRGDAECAVVMPMAVPEESHLGTLKGGNNAVILSSPSMGETVQLGTGTGSMPVASAVLNDLIGLYHPSRSWTARLKRTEKGPAAPRFTRWLALDEGRLVLVKDKQEGGVPLFDSLASD